MILNIIKLLPIQLRKMTTTILSVKIPETSGMIWKYPSSQAPMCCFCKRTKNDDETPLSKVPFGITQGIISFPMYYCFDCAGDGKLSYILEFLIKMDQPNSFLMIHFEGHIIVNPSEIYVPCIGRSENLQFLCWGRKCHMSINCDSLFNSIIRGCVIDPQSGAIEKMNVSIRDILLGIIKLNQILESSDEHPFLKKITEIDGKYLDCSVMDAIDQLPSDGYVGPRIDYFSFDSSKMIFELFSLMNSGFYSKDAIDSFFGCVMTRNIIELFIWKCLISMTTFMKKNGAALPDLAQFEPNSRIDGFLTQNHGRTDLAFTMIDVLCVNSRIFLKLVRRIIRLLHRFNNETYYLDMFQYSKYLYSMIYVINQDRFARNGVSLESLSRFRKYTKRFKKIMNHSPFCKHTFQQSVEPVEPDNEIDLCVICQIKPAYVIGRCDVHNVSCYGCFSNVLKNCTKCPSCRNPDFLP